MSGVHIKDIDLNLLVALDVLLEERHITKSANRLDITQPAMSRTLNRLRITFGDPLIIRTPNGYVPTKRAEDLVHPIKDILNQIQRTLTEPTFDPATAVGEFKICTLGYGEVVVVPRFIEIVSRGTSNVEIGIVPRSLYSNESILEGRADILFGAMLEATSKSCVIQPLYEDRFVCTMSERHPLAKNNLTLEGYLEYPHSIIHTGERSGTHIDTLLKQLGHKRKIQKRSPHWTSSLMSLATTDFLQTVPERMARSLATVGGFVVKDLPFDLEPSKLEMMWHARNNADPRHRWFREKFIEATERP
jgi:DNA-binding transcriptional LysR family regulator